MAHRCLRHFFRSYWGRQKEFTAVVRLKEMQQVRTVILRAEDFTTADEERVSSWDHADLLSFRAYVEKDGRVLGSKHWNGKQPVLNGLGWVGENE